jgi:hypothetical protein
MRWLLALSLCLFGWQAEAAYSLIAHTSVNGNVSTTITTPAINTTGANLIVAVFSWYTAGTKPTLSDSSGNTWLVARNDDNIANGGSLSISYVQAPTVSASHTFTITGTNNFSTLFIEAWSGSAASPLDQTNEASSGGSSVSSQQTGSVTPGQANELLIAGLVNGGSTSTSFAINSGFTIPDAVNPGTSGQNYGAGAAYFVQGAAAAINPTWSWTTAQITAASIATFKPSVAAAAVPERTKMGVGQ